MKLCFSTDGGVLGLRDSPFLAPTIAPRGTHATGALQGQSKGTEQQGKGQTRDAVSCKKVHGTTQTPCTRLPRCNVTSAQSLATLFPLVSSSSQLSFLQLLLLEQALESPDFAELFKVVSENTARNLFQWSFSKSCF